ncbi:MAG: hypothetical protein LBB77_02205 [Treponema sp.]|jgi:hypothetical protein|nr:hypothetical protein [Treponema sp.]
MVFHRFLPCFLLPFFLFSCGKGGPPPDSGGTAPDSAEAAPEAGDLPPPPESLIAVLRPGENPLWFDVSGAAAGPGGTAVEEDAEGGAALAGRLRLVDSPAGADLAPFTPWPLAPHGAAMLVHGEVVYLALNRDSLLAFFPLEGGDLGLCRFTAADYWESYTVGNLFLYDDKPALFFYRDDMFAEPAVPPPGPPVLVLCPGSPPAGGSAPAMVYGSLAPLEIPALADIPFDEGWEADILRPGADGLWYYRGVRRKNGGRETRYFRSADLSLGGEEIGPGLYRNSQKEENPGPDVSDLPPLPEDFVYTRVVRLGDLVIASWEEQQDYNIGAAGFMVVR